MSYCIQLFFGTTFYFTQFVDATVIQAFWPNHKPIKVTSWLKGHHHSCLYTSMFFTLALSLACAIQVFRRNFTGEYQMLGIGYSLTVSICSFIAICVSSYDPLPRPKLFVVGFVATLVLGFVTSLALLIFMENDVNHVTNACYDYAVANRLGWSDAVLGNVSARTELIPGIASGFLLLLIIALWLVLRRWKAACRRERYSVTTPWVSL